MSARRAAFLLAGALVAVGTLAYAFATRGPIEPQESALEAGGRPVAGPVELDACLDLDLKALEALNAELRLGCLDATEGATPPTPDDGAAPSRPPTDGDASAPGSGPAPLPPPATPVSSSPSTPRVPTPPSNETDGSDAAQVDDDAPTAEDGSEAERPAGSGSAAWQHELLGALGPLFTPPSDVPTIYKDARSSCPVWGACDTTPPRGGARGPEGAPLFAQPTFTREGLLSRALDALDAYIWLRS